MRPCRESEFLAQVRQAARLYGWLTYHTLDSRGSDAGFPDLVLAKPGSGRVLALELKVGTRQPTAAQVAWLRALEEGGVVCRVFRPEDWQQIVALLEEV